jgi:ubiquinone/menaquinone biosynthesis C-methylase UbiE
MSAQAVGLMGATRLAPQCLGGLNHHMTEISDSPFEGLGRSYMLTDHNGVAPLQVQEYERFANMLASRPGVQHVLDWGCGFGHLAHALDERGLSVSLYDYVPDLPSPAAVRLTAHPRLTANLSSEPVSLPYADGQFDAVVSMGTLEHVQYPQRSLAELRRILRPGGLLCVYKLPNRFSYVEYLAKRTGRYYHGKLEHDSIYRIRTARALVTQAGFTVQDVRRMNMLPLMTLSRKVEPRWHRLLGAANLHLSRFPGLNVMATNVQVLASRD